MFAARIASVPKIVFSVAVRCASLIPTRPLLKSAITAGIPRNLPLASNTATPMSSIACFARFDGAASESSIVFTLVPASDPLMPAFASCPSSVVSSSIGIPIAAATDALIFSAFAISGMLAVVAFALAASRSATRDASVPARPNALRLSATIVAASAFEICAAADSSSVPRAASIASLTLSPPFASSVIASAASAALVPGGFVSAPSLIAASDTRPISRPVAPAVAWKTFSVCSMSPAASSAFLKPTPAAIVSPAPRYATPFAATPAAPATLPRSDAPNPRASRLDWRNAAPSRDGSPVILT